MTKFRTKGKGKNRKVYPIGRSSRRSKRQRLPSMLPVRVRIPKASIRGNGTGLKYSWQTRAMPDWGRPSGKRHAETWAEYYAHPNEYRPPRPNAGSANPKYTAERRQAYALADAGLDLRSRFELPVYFVGHSAMILKPKAKPGETVRFEDKYRYMMDNRLIELSNKGGGIEIYIGDDIAKDHKEGYHSAKTMSEANNVLKNDIDLDKMAVLLGYGRGWWTKKVRQNFKELEEKLGEALISRDEASTSSVVKNPLSTVQGRAVVARQSKRPEFYTVRGYSKEESKSTPGEYINSLESIETVMGKARAEARERELKSKGMDVTVEEGAYGA